MMRLSFADGLAVRFLLLGVVGVVLAGCAGEPVSSFSNGRPRMDPIAYFAGRTHSWGIIETASGQPKETIHTSTVGHVEDGVLHFEQDIAFEHGRKEHRSWIVRRVDEHDYTATGTGIVGTAHGVAYGNVFHLDFTLDAIPGNPLGHVHMSQWMYLQEGGVTLVNRDTLTKAGLILAQITEQFRKDQ